MKTMKKNISLLVCIMLILSSFQGVFAQINDQNTILEGTIVTGQFEVEVINDSEVHYTYDGVNGKIKTIVKKNEKKVTAEYFSNGRLILNYEYDLNAAIEIGSKLKDSHNNNTKDGKNNFTPTWVDDGGGGGGVPSGSYRFDGIVYTPKSTTQDYPHPNRAFYGISTTQTWKKAGNNLDHIQINKYDSNSLLQSPTWAIASGIGALIGGLISGNFAGAVIGAIIGGALGGYFGGQVTRLADESGCVWVVFDSNPELVNMGSTAFPAYYGHYSFLSVGPFSKTDYYHPM